MGRGRGGGGVVKAGCERVEEGCGRREGKERGRLWVCVYG